MQYSCIKWGEKLQQDEVPGGGCILHSACRRKQIIRKHDAQTHKIGINGVSLVFSLQVTARESQLHTPQSQHKLKKNKKKNTCQHTTQHTHADTLVMLPNGQVRHKEGITLPNELLRFNVQMVYHKELSSLEKVRTTFLKWNVNDCNG